MRWSIRSFLSANSRYSTVGAYSTLDAIRRIVTFRDAFLDNDLFGGVEHPLSQSLGFSLLAI